MREIMTKIVVSNNRTDTEIEYNNEEDNQFGLTWNTGNDKRLSIYQYTDDNKYNCNTLGKFHDYSIVQIVRKKIHT